MSKHTILNIADIEDQAPKFGLGEQGQARFAFRQLGAERTGFSFQSLVPGARQAFGHRHSDAEEIYLVLSGSGRIALDDEVHDVGPHDVIRVAPGVTRAFEAGSDGLEFVAVGARHEGDAEMVPGWWAGEGAAR